MNITFLADRIPPYELGGAGKIVWRLAQGLHHLGHQVSIITATSDSEHHTLQDGIPVYYLHSRYHDRWRGWLSLYNPQTVGRVRRLLQQLAPDVVNAHNLHTDLSYGSLVTAHRLGLPVIFSSHDVMPFAYGKIDYFVRPDHGYVNSPADYRLPWSYNLRLMRFRYNPFHNPLVRYILKHHAQARIAVSQAHKAALEANGLPPFQVSSHGFDSAEYAQPDSAIMEAMRETLGLKDRRVIFFGGRLSEGKGGHQLLAALNETVQQIPQATLLILSATPFDKSLLSAYPNLKPEHIREGGWRTGAELLTAYHLADVVAVPSIYLDPSPTIVFEAMAAGKPVLVSGYSGASEAVIDGKTGYIINPFDVIGFADKLTRLLGQPDHAEALGRAGQAHLTQNFTVEQQLTRMLQIYQAAIRSNKEKQP